MRDANTIVRERQQDIRCAMDDLDISLKAAAGKADMPVSTFTSYFHAEKDRIPATLNVAGLFKLVKGEALPLDLLSMLLPNGYQIVRAPDEIDHDRLCEIMASYLAEKNRAHHPDSEAGRDIGPNESANLGCIVMQLVGGIAA
ncbi:hypothetical protein [Sphingomonas albertensis]|uniref:XRE family transcriptional regulator n=1 Tax=Sphingomonas albertensis TaxID=2762591 RepID=A0ABR7AS88_9SPHN|nr:hypothetical protein [Sphingomonas albertensis]MBC3943324.1 hypothetical protein [Sphingomonas albertensis]